MLVTFIPGDSAKQGRANCYRYLREKFLTLKADREKGQTDDSNLRAGIDRRSGEARLQP